VTPTVSLYVPCFNAAPYLGEVLPALFAQTHPVHELLLVDDGSRDDTAALVERHARGAPFPTRVLRHGDNRGLAAARNTAVLAATGEFVASVDADVVARPEWLTLLMAEFTEEHIAGIGGCLVERHVSTMADHWRDTHMRQCRGPKRLVDPPFLFGSNTVFRTDALRHAGLYDERCRTNGEDAAISEAVRQTGGQLIYTPDARCEHLRHDSLASIMRTYWRWNRGGRQKPLTGRNTRRALTRNFRRINSHCLKPDLRARDWSNVAVDLMQPWYAGWLDVRAYLATGRPPVGERVS
jgi:glycosyltransferase involved in cell wall biosynthesis